MRNFWLILMIAGSNIFAASLISIAPNTWDQSGVTVAPAGGTSLAAQIARSPLYPLRALAPFSITLRNGSSRIPIALTVRYQITRADGKVVFQTHRYVGPPSTISPSVSPLAPNTDRLITPVIWISQATALAAPPSISDTVLTEASQQLALFQAAQMVAVSLDSIVWDDRHIVGPDVAGSMKHFNDIASAGAAFRTHLASLIASNASDASIAEWLQLQQSTKVTVSSAYGLDAYTSTTKRLASTSLKYFANGRSALSAGLARPEFTVGPIIR